MAALLRELASEVLRHAPSDGENATVIPGLTLHRASSATILQRGVLRPSFCVVVQGEKLAQAGTDTTFRYGAGDFLASSIDMPASGQVIGATKSRPYLAARFELTPQDVLSVLRDAEVHVDTTAPGSGATFVGTSDARLLDVVSRTLACLDDGQEARFLAPLLRRELVYRLVTGPSAAAVCQSALLARADDGVGRAVDWIRAHFKERLSIPDLAKRSSMSTSSFQHKFKRAVLMGPLQYQKRLRLEEARRLLLGGQAGATSAAFEVGYESPSQFTREYRRQFGLPPLRDALRMRGEAVPPELAP